MVKNDQFDEYVKLLQKRVPLVIDGTNYLTISAEYGGASVKELFGFYYPNFLIKNIKVNGKHLADHLILDYFSFFTKLGKLTLGTKIRFKAKVIDERALVNASLYGYHNKFCFEDIHDIQLVNAKPGERLPEDDNALVGYVMLNNPEFYDPWHVVQYYKWLVKQHLSTKEVEENLERHRVSGKKIQKTIPVIITKKDNHYLAMSYDLLMVAQGKNQKEAVRKLEEKILEQSCFVQLPEIAKKMPKVLDGDILKQVSLEIWDKPILPSKRIKSKQWYVDYTMKYAVENSDNVDYIRRDFMSSEAFASMADPQLEIWDEEPEYFYAWYLREKDEDLTERR